MSFFSDLGKSRKQSTPVTFDVERAKFAKDFVCKDFPDKRFPTAETAVSFLKSKMLDNDRVEVIDLHEKRITTYKRKFGDPFEVCHFFTQDGVSKQLSETKQIL